MPALTYDFTGIVPTADPKDEYEKKIIELAATHEEIYLLTCDLLVPGNRMLEFRDLYPDRFIDVGIAEANVVGIAAGIGLAGGIPFAQAMGPFISLRATDQVHTDVAYNDVPVRLSETHGGVTGGGGPTHNSVLDFAIMRGIPNMTIVAPSDANQCSRLVEASLTYPGPMFLRIGKLNSPLVYKNQDYDYTIGKAVLTKEGSDATVIGTGITVSHALKAAQELQAEGISVRVLDMHTVKPLDVDAVLKAAKETGIIVTVEDHTINGGLGGAVAEVAFEAGVTCKFKRLGVPDMFSVLGSVKQLYALYGIDTEGIKKQIRSML